MQLRQSERKQAKIKMALQGSAGSGKTFSSLLLAKGLTNGDFSKVAIIDTENGSADLYAHLGNYNVVSLKPPFTPQQYVDAITLCENSAMEVIIIDSISHCWDYLLDYEFTLVFDVDIKHFAVSSKDRTELFMGKPEFQITEQTGVKILNWCNSGKLDRYRENNPNYNYYEEKVNKLPVIKPEVAFQPKSNLSSEQEVFEAIGRCNTIAELLALYKQYPQFHESLRVDFEARKSIIMNLTNPNNFSQNGHNKIQ